MPAIRSGPESPIFTILDYMVSIEIYDYLKIP